MLRTRDGRMIHDVAFAMVLRDMPGVNAFKIIQESYDHCVLQLATDDRYRREQGETMIRATFCARLGADATVEIKYVDRILPEATGKYRYVVSKIAQAPVASRDVAN